MIATDKKKPAALGVTEVCLRDGHQSLLATRLRTDDLLPICAPLDRAGFWSIECWGGATYDACIRFLGEDPWERLRAFREAMPNSRLQMLLRGQNLLGYRHYADDVVDAFVEQSAAGGIDVFRVFDALNDPRNLARALHAVRAVDRHAQGTLSYTTSPVHNLQYWLDLARRIEDLGVDSLVIKDMAGLLTPYAAEELIGGLKELVSVPLHMHCHATTGLSTATALKAVEAGLDNVDTSISSMSLTYGHSATETIAAIFDGTPRDPGLDPACLTEVATHFRRIRQRYAAFEGSMRGVDARIIKAQIPGGMLSNLESQLRQQKALNRLDEVIEEIPKVRRDLGYIPLVTPSSQIVGAQALLNVLMGERYKKFTSETRALLRGEYGDTPAPVDAELKSRSEEQDGDAHVAAGWAKRPPELDKLKQELKEQADTNGLETTPGDFFTYALFSRVGLDFLRNRNNASFFEVPPAEVEASAAGHYLVRINGQAYDVAVAAGQIESMQPLSGGAVTQATSPAAPAAAASAGGSTVVAPLAGTVLSLEVKTGEKVMAKQVLMKIEALKMETEICAHQDAQVVSFSVAVGDQVVSGDELLRLV